MFLHFRVILYISPDTSDGQMSRCLPSSVCYSGLLQGTHVQMIRYADEKMRKYYGTISCGRAPLGAGAWAGK